MWVQEALRGQGEPTVEGKDGREGLRVRSALTAVRITFGGVRARASLRDNKGSPARDFPIPHALPVLPNHHQKAFKVVTIYIRLYV